MGVAIDVEEDQTIKLYRERRSDIRRALVCARDGVFMPFTSSLHSARISSKKLYLPFKAVERKLWEIYYHALLRRQDSKPCHELSDELQRDGFELKMIKKGVEELHISREEINSFVSRVADDVRRSFEDYFFSS